jgi:hypothetical protein
MTVKHTGVKMKIIELTEEEQEALQFMFDEDLKAYLSYSESGKLCEDVYSKLFRKLGIDLTGEENA